MTKVFVYGTLKKGFHNHRVIEKTLIKKISEAKLEGYVMHYVNHGGYPVIMPQEGSVVYGELIEFKKESFREQLESLDFLEGFRGEGCKDNLYNRIKADVIVGDEKITAYVYEFNYKNYALVVGDLIENGIFEGPKKMLNWRR